MKSLPLTTFRAIRAEVEEDGKDALICDIEEGKDEVVAREVVGVATYCNVDCITSNDQGKGLDNEVDSVGEMKSVGDDSSDEISSSNSNIGFDEDMDRENYLQRFESSRTKNKKEIQRLKEENLKLSTKVTHLSEEVVRS